MTAKKIDGKALAKEIRLRVTEGLRALEPFRPRLVSLYVGDDAASAVYIRNQQRACHSVGIDFELCHLPAQTSEEDLLSKIDELEKDEAVTAIILQRPLPPNINQRRIHASIPVAKDVEGLNPANVGFIALGEPRLAPCTALAAVHCARSTGIDFRGKDVVVVGHSEIVGKPLAFLMLNHFATTTICHIATKDLESHVRSADIVFVAVGKPGLIRGSMVKPGAIVVDIGICQVPMTDENGQPVRDPEGKPRMRLVGDVDYDSVVEVASHLTPVPGGVGPVTVATLLQNVYVAACQQRGMEVNPEELLLL